MEIRKERKDRKKTEEVKQERKQEVGRHDAVTMKCHIFKLGRGSQTTDDHLIQHSNVWELMETNGTAGAVSGVLGVLPSKLS